VTGRRDATVNKNNVVAIVVDDDDLVSLFECSGNSSRRSAADYDEGISWSVFFFL
jgi:hypothetical protein